MKGGFLFENLWLKIAALVLAVLLWIFVSAKGQTDISLDVQIDYINIPKGLEISKRSAKTAVVVLRGHESLLKNVRQGDVRIAVDMSKAKEGEGVFSIRRDDVAAPRATSVIKIDPSSVKVVVEHAVVKEVPVRPVLSGSPEIGYVVRSVELKPKEVTIEGAASEVNKVNYLKTEPIDVTGLAEDLKQEADIALSGRNIRTGTDKVNVVIKVVRRSK
jgi:YbbR domain-containing protein